MAFLPSEDDALPWPDDAVEVGRILGAWGIKGGFRVQPFAADPQALFSSRRWFLKAADSARPVTKPAKSAKATAAPASAAELPAMLKITLARDQGDSIVATAHEVPDRDTAERLKGVRIFISRASFPTPDPDEFYWVDLIGLAVTNRGDQALGTVVGLIETGPHCVIRIQPAAAEAEELLIPFVEAYVDAVDMPARLIKVDWDLDE